LVLVLDNSTVFLVGNGVDVSFSGFIISRRSGCVVGLPKPRLSAILRVWVDWLRKHGIDDLVEEGRQYWIANSAKPDLKAVRMRSRVAEAEALCDPAGLGSFKVLEWRR